MAKMCNSCGTVVDDNFQNCPNCGAIVAPQQVQQPQMQQQMGYQQPQMQQQMGYQQPQMQPMGGAPIPNRSIVTAILLSFVTCGIYGIYWMIKLNDEANVASGDVNGTSGGTVFLFTLLTCGIYGLYWYYQMGKKMQVVGQRYGKPINDNSILYLILGVFGVGIVNYCLIQNDLNSVANQ